MPRTKYSLTEPIPYEDTLDLVDKAQLIAHVIQLEQTLVQRDADLDAIKTMRDNISEKREELERQLEQAEHSRGSKQAWADLNRRADALELDNKTLRSQLAHNNNAPTRLDAEDREAITAYLKTLLDPTITYHAKGPARGFAESLIRLLDLDKEQILP